jgi:hypothetical protein
MAARKFTPESRRAMFTALVVSTTAGEAELSLGRILSAVLRTPSAVALCDKAHVAASGLLDRVDSAQTPLFSECLWRVESELALAGHSFGSQEHMDSLQPLPLSAEAQRMLARVDEISDGAESDSATPIHLLLALTQEPSVSAELAALGLTQNVVASAVARK